MTALLFTNARVFDGVSGDCAEGMNVLVADGLIREMGTLSIDAPGARRLDVGGRTLMPGLIDAHVHAFASDIVLQAADAMGEAYRTGHAVRMLGHALQCGFTSVRDVGGGNYGLYRAASDGFFPAPRFFYSGKILSMTGGHGDFRHPEQVPHYQALCNCSGIGFNCMAVLADGVDEVIKAAREELRQGAHCIKIMGSGGVTSPTDPIWMNQYTEKEVRAIVAECEARRTYVTAHCHPTSAVRRSIEFGVRCIEHGTLIDADTAALVAERGAYVVPTLITLKALLDMSRQPGFAAQTRDKVDEVWRQAVQGLDLMRTAGVKVVFGSDLLGETYTRQCEEFTLRREVFTPLEILRQATSVAADMMMLDGRLGCVAPGAYADLIVVDGDPLRDISLLAANGANLRVIMRAGELVKNEL